MQKRRGRPKDISPIARKVRALVHNDPRMTLEKICVVCEIKYNSLNNIFSRLRISENIIKSLKYGGIINEQDIDDHYDWLLEKRKK